MVHRMYLVRSPLISSIELCGIISVWTLSFTGEEQQYCSTQPHPDMLSHHLCNLFTPNLTFRVLESCSLVPRLLAFQPLYSMLVKAGRGLGMRLLIMPIAWNQVWHSHPCICMPGVNIGSCPSFSGATKHMCWTLFLWLMHLHAWYNVDVHCTPSAIICIHASMQVLNSF